MSQKLVYKLILITCVLTTQVGMAAGKIPNTAIRNYRGMSLVDDSLYMDKVAIGSECDLLLTAAQDELGRELKMAEIEAEIPQLRNQLRDSFQVLFSAKIGSRALFKAMAIHWEAKILTPGGEKSIVELRLGESILTFNPATFQVTPSTVLINRFLVDVPLWRMKLAGGDSLSLGRSVEVGTGSIENVQPGNFRFTLSKKLFFARRHAGQIEFEAHRSWIPKIKPQMGNGSFLVTQNGQPFFANGLLVYSLNKFSHGR